MKLLFTCVHETGLISKSIPSLLPLNHAPAACRHADQDQSFYSVPILEDGKSLGVELGLILFPLARVELLQTLVPQNFELLVSLLKFELHVLLIGLIALANREFVVRFVPLCIPTDGVQLAGVVLVVVFVVFASAPLHNGMFRALEIALCLHHFYCFCLLKTI